MSRNELTCRKHDGLADERSHGRQATETDHVALMDTARMSNGSAIEKASELLQTQFQR
jgi:hypothetical protein